MNSIFSIGGRKVGTGQPTFIIAEVGINHGGDVDLCRKMIDAAAAAGADAVKLQTVDPRESYHPDTASYREFSDKVLPPESHADLIVYAASKGTILFSTPGDFASLDLLVGAGVQAIKISSGLLSNLPIIRRAAETGVPLILSTGMAYLEEVVEAVAALREAGGRDAAILQCTSLYPAAPNTLNLNAMATIADVTGCPVGYSDHHEGTLACLAAVAAGACVIEKHFTLDSSVAGADHAISIEPDEFADMVRDIRRIEAMRGSREKKPTPSEVPLRDQRHRYLVARHDLAKGNAISADDIALMRLPGGRGELPANRYESLLGKTVSRDIAALQPIGTNDVEGLS